MNKKDIRILIACEESQTIATAFRKLGFQAYSCDLKECSGGHPEYHIKGDCFDIIENQRFDLIVAHPPCTYLSVAGARWFSNPERKPLQDEAIEFFLRFTRLECEHVAIENPIGIMSTRFRKPDQIIQPFQFGDSFRKSTCLWLKGLPKLKPTNIVDEGEQITFASGKKCLSGTRISGECRKNNGRNLEAKHSLVSLRQSRSNGELTF